MTTRKVIYDEANTIFTKPARKKIKNALLLAGGGTTQTFFAMGAVACLVDNGLFDFDLITAVSGGTILLNFIDLCYNEEYNYYKEHDWYNRYVRKNMYAMTNTKLLPYFIKSGFDSKKANDYLFEQIPDFNKKRNGENKTMICEFNYIDADIDDVVCDMSDIMVDEFWFVKRLLRCSLPFSNFNNRPAYDAGNVGNLPVSRFIKNYDVERVIIVKSYNMIQNDIYPEQTLRHLLINLLFNNSRVSENCMNQLLSFGVNQNPNNIFCCFSNDLNPSDDKIHKNIHNINVVNDVNDINDILIWYGHGILYQTGDIPKILENDGYIQMYSQLKRTGEANVFKIPNPEVYNEIVVSKIANWKSQIPIIETIKHFIMP